jgi:hypothetical protein
LWPVKALLRQLPDHLQVVKSEGVLVLRCRRCGWTTTFSALGARLKDLIATAGAHHCPESHATAEEATHGKHSIQHGAQALVIHYIDADGRRMREARKRRKGTKRAVRG